MTLLHSDSMCAMHNDDCLDAGCPDRVLGVDGTADALIFDAPYSEKTHEGHANGKHTSDSLAAFGRRNVSAGDGKRAAEARYAQRAAAGSGGRRDIEYDAFTSEKIETFCCLWLSRCRGWVVSITDDVLAPNWAKAFTAAGLYAFAPLPLVETGSRVRMTGDGPSNWTCWLVVARPKSREFASWGTLPGAYVQAAEREINSLGGSDRIVGGKPLRAMCGIVRDYSRRGQLVVDPFCGGGTTGMAAKQLGRRFVGVEENEERAKLCARKLRGTREQGDLFEKASGE